MLNRRCGSLVIIALSIALALTLGATDAVAINVEIYEGDTNPESFTTTDYHVTITSDGAITNVEATISLPDGTFQEATISGEGTNEVMVDWFNATVPSGASIGFCITFTTAGSSYTVKKAWTAVASSTDIPALGSSFPPSGDYALTNDYPMPVDYSDLQYDVQPASLPGTPEDLALMLRNVAEGAPFNPGWTPLPDGTVNPLSDSGTLVNVAVGDGQFLLTFHRSEFSGGPPGISPTIQVIGRPPAVPASSTKEMIFIGLLLASALAGAAVWRRRRRPA